ncbi:MAG: YaaR family protein [Clostridiales bacterium]|nr:YaaR family protein [Clostridiales bacterium]
MTDVQGVHPKAPLAPLSSAVVSGGSAGNAFREHLGHQLKEEYKRHIDSLFDELAGLADSITGRSDISLFEQYRGRLKELLAEVMKNAYILSPEYVTDKDGRQRVFATINIIDGKLDGLAKEILSENSGKLDFLSRVDEIRGLIMDMLL